MSASEGHPEAWGPRLQPLTAMAPAACRALRGVAFDVDDTVTADGRLELEAYDALWRLARAGLRLIALTGRPLGWADVIARQWPVDVAVGENGAGWVYRAGPASAQFIEGYFDPPEVRAAQQRRLAALCTEVARTLPDVVPASDQRARRCDVAFDVGETAAIAPATLARLQAAIEAAGARCSVSSVHAHAVFGTWDKARGLVRAAAEALGDDVAADRARWMFVGDSGNDAAAFAYFPLSVGVANVRAHLPRLPVPPAFVTDAPRGAGFAEAASWLLRHRAGAS